MRWGRGSAAKWSRDARAPAAAGQRTVAHATGSLGPPVTHGVAHLGASVQKGTREPAVVHLVVGWGQLETQRHGLTFLRCSLRVQNGRMIVEMMVNYSPDIEPYYDGIGM
jgi:hypothetical protein